jgi:hypothetical protein
VTAELEPRLAAVLPLPPEAAQVDDGTRDRRPRVSPDFRQLLGQARQHAGDTAQAPLALPRGPLMVCMSSRRSRGGTCTPCCSTRSPPSRAKLSTKLACSL